MSGGALDLLFEALAIPPAALVDKRVAKALLIERGGLTATDRRLIETGLERLSWRATLRPSTAGLAAFQDAARDYGQLVVMTAHLREEAKAGRLVEIIHRAIAHPLALIAGLETSATFSIGLKRRHEREADRVVVDHLTISAPITIGDAPLEQAFLASLTLAAASAHDLWSLHTGWGERIEALAAAKITGAYRLPRDEAEASTRRELLKTYAVEAREAAQLRKAAAKEPMLNRRLDLSREIARAEAGLAQLRQNLA